MTVDFPAFCPTKRRLTPGQYAVKRFDSISGAGITRLYGSKAFNASLRLEFFLADDEIAEFVEAYHASKGGFDDLTLPAAIYSGMSSNLQDEIRDYYSWRFESPPAVESVISGRSRINVSLIGTLDG